MFRLDGTRHLYEGLVFCGRTVKKQRTLYRTTEYSLVTCKTCIRWFLHDVEGVLLHAAVFSDTTSPPVVGTP